MYVLKQKVASSDVHNMFVEMAGELEASWLELLRCELAGVIHKCRVSKAVDALHNLIENLMASPCPELAQDPGAAAYVLGVIVSSAGSLIRMGTASTTDLWCLACCYAMHHRNCIPEGISCCVFSPRTCVVSND